MYSKNRRVVVYSRCKQKKAAFLHLALQCLNGVKGIDKYLRETLRSLLGFCVFLDGRDPYPVAAALPCDRKRAPLRICPFDKVLRLFGTSLQKEK